MSMELLTGLQQAETDLLRMVERVRHLQTLVPIDMTPDPQPPVVQPPAQPTVRRSAGADKLRIKVQKASTPVKVWRLTDLWTTIEGSWEPSASVYSVPEWARSEFMSVFPMTGGNHNIYAVMLAPIGEGKVAPVRDERMKFWHNHGAFFQQPKSAGYFEQDIFGSFNPDAPEQSGGWSVSPEHPISDMVSGMGLPMNQHVSLFCVWRWVP